MNAHVSNIFLFQEEKCAHKQISVLRELTGKVVIVRNDIICTAKIVTKIWKLLEILKSHILQKWWMVQHKISPLVLVNLTIMIRISFLKSLKKPIKSNGGADKFLLYKQWKVDCELSNQEAKTREKNQGLPCQLYFL